MSSVTFRHLLLKREHAVEASVHQKEIMRMQGVSQAPNMAVAGKQAPTLPGKPKKRSPEARRYG
jgi:hypothetical protein